MRQEPGLEAVKIDRTRHAISVATLGRCDRSELEERLSRRIQQMQEPSGKERCALLDGSQNCSRCTIASLDAAPVHLTVRHDRGATTISRATCPTAPSFWRWHAFPWPKIVPLEVAPLEHDDEQEWKLQLVAAGLCGLCALGAALVNEASVKALLHAGAYVAGAWFPAQEVWERLQKGTLDVHFLMLAVAVGSASIGAWSEGAMLLFLFSLSGGLEHYAMGRTQREIRSLFKSAPKTARVLDESGNDRIVPVNALRPGMRLLIKPSDQFPVDGEVIRGRTAADESNLSGEAAPVEKEIGDTVLGGTLNLWGAVEIAVLREPGQSALQRIIHLIREAQHAKASSQRFTDLFGTRYTYAVLVLCLIVFCVWWLGVGRPPLRSSADEKSAFYLAMTLLVVSSPCALVLSIPSSVLAAIAWAARRGILFRGGAAVEQLAVIDCVAMDKTGTLTTGELMVERIESFPPGAEDLVGQLAFSLERLSTHPLARAITRYGKRRGWPAVDLTEFESMPGLGLQARWKNEVVRLGRREWLAAQNPAIASLHASPSPPGVSEVWIAHGDLIGRVILRDDIRVEARNVVQDLRRLGLRTIVLTGDRRATGEHLRAALEIEEVRAELKPEQKVEAIQSLVAAGRQVAMIGDGVNDAPSLAAAHVGVAMGARGSDAALEQADIVLMNDRLENFRTAFELSRRARRIIRQNLVISLGAVVILVAFAIIGHIPLTLGVIGHEGSTVLVVLNSLRLLLSPIEKKPLMNAD